METRLVVQSRTRGKWQTVTTATGQEYAYDDTPQELAKARIDIALRLGCLHRRRHLRIARVDATGAVLLASTP